jgi:hypothetical protein
MIDLDLDVIVQHDGTVEIEDEDEFRAHQVKYGYTREMILRAEAETERIVGELENQREPFFDVAGEWLSRVS